MNWIFLLGFSTLQATDMQFSAEVSSQYLFFNYHQHTVLDANPDERFLTTTDHNPQAGIQFENMRLGYSHLSNADKFENDRSLETVFVEYSNLIYARLNWHHVSSSDNPWAPKKYGIAWFGVEYGPMKALISYEKEFAWFTLELESWDIVARLHHGYMFTFLEGDKYQTVFSLAYRFQSIQ